MGVAAGVAVAIAVVAVSVSAYESTRSTLQGQIDNSLREITAHYVNSPAGAGNQGPGGPFNGTPQGTGFPGPSQGGGGFVARPHNGRDCGLGINIPSAPAFGGAAGFVQLITKTGSVCRGSGERLEIPADQRAVALAKSGHGEYFTDKAVDGDHIRVLVTGVSPFGALEVALPLSDVDHTLSHELLLMVIVAAAGIALAALLGLLVARTALAPIARFTRQTEAIAAKPDRPEIERIDVSGKDELARLGRSFNTTLDALERSIGAQRNLVADASHELRTPIASIRANLQLLRDESQLPESDREALREDMILELDELTALVGDVVELARGAQPGSGVGDVRLDEIVSSVVERTRRRGPELTIQAALEPTLVRGEGDRMARAVTNVLDNARKWSPTGGLIEVDLHGGTLSVRDHGPGFHDEDLPFVFDRFHRARDARSKPGSGLGLAIVRQAVEAHGGTVEAGNAPGGGAVLRLSFGPSTVPEAQPGDPAVAT
jgi:two-component system sensor histidine kinase MprB